MINKKYIGSSVNETVNELIENDPEFKQLMDTEQLINEICSQIIKIRKEKGLTQNELGNLINTKQTSISRLEKGNLKKLPTIEFLNRIANALNKHLIVKFE